MKNASKTALGSLFVVAALAFVLPAHSKSVQNAVGVVRAQSAGSPVPATPYVCPRQPCPPGSALAPTWYAR